MTAGQAASSIPLNVGYVFHPASIPAVESLPGRSLQERLGFSLDLRWMYLFYRGVLPRPAVLLIPLAMLGASAWLARRAWLLGGA